jgi:hypothetical protein
VKAFGYIREDDGAEVPQPLREVTLKLSKEELDRVIDFLRHVKRGFEESALSAGESHFHFRDWFKGWRRSDSDLIVVYDSPPARSRRGP